MTRGDRAYRKRRLNFCLEACCAYRLPNTRCNWTIGPNFVFFQSELDRFTHHTNSWLPARLSKTLTNRIFLQTVGRNGPINCYKRLSATDPSMGDPRNFCVADDAGSVLKVPATESKILGHICSRRQPGRRPNLASC